MTEPVDRSVLTEKANALTWLGDNRELIQQELEQQGDLGPVTRRALARLMGTGRPGSDDLEATDADRKQRTVSDHAAAVAAARALVAVRRRTGRRVPDHVLALAQEQGD